MFRLMIKTHNVTGLNYLCVTEKEKYHRYPGSGLYWRRHLKIHGKDITTTVIFESETKTKEFVLTCLYYSELYDIVESESWANLIPENANSVGRRAPSSKETSETIKRGLAKFFDRNNPAGNAFRLAMSKRMLEFSNDPAIRAKRSADRLKYLAQEGSRDIISKSCREFWVNASEEYLQAHRDATSKGRLNMSPEKKKLRAERVKEAFKNSPARHLSNARMKTERLGSGNPNSRGIMWYGRFFESRREFDRFALTELEISKGEAYRMLADPNIKECYKDNPTIRPLQSCPHCGKQSTNPASLARWHNDNCKNKVKDTPSNSVELNKENEK